jgi:hypothetical protein
MILIDGRSGRPSYSDPWVDQVTWVAGMLMMLVYFIISLDTIRFALHVS